MINLTPHPITVFGDWDLSAPLRSIPPSGYLARVATTRIPSVSVDGLPTYRTEFGDVVITGPSGSPVQSIDGTPAIRGNWIVSSLVRAAWIAAGNPLADHAWIPGDTVRDSTGRIIGCIGLSQ